MEQLLELLKPLLEAFGGQSGVVVQVIAWVGSARLLLKPLQPLMLAIEEIIVKSETKKDDELLAKLKASKAVRIVKYLADYLLSIKLK